MKKVKLKTCPFCGKVIHVELGINNIHFFMCAGCGAIVSFQNLNNNKKSEPDDVYASWNQREDVTSV